MQGSDFVDNFVIVLHHPDWQYSSVNHGRHLHATGLPQMQDKIFSPSHEYFHRLVFLWYRILILGAGNSFNTPGNLVITTSDAISAALQGLLLVNPALFLFFSTMGTCKCLCVFLCTYAVTITCCLPFNADLLRLQKS